MKIKSYKKTGLYYIDDEAEDDNGMPFNEKVYEYFFYFDDGIEFVWYVPETILDESAFATDNHLKQKYDLVKSQNKKETCEQQAVSLRSWLSREFGVENNNFPEYAKYR